MRSIGVVLSFIVGFVLWFWISLGGVESFGAVGAPGEAGLGRAIGGYLATILGVILGSIYRELTRLRDRGETEVRDIRLLLVRLVRSIDFLMSIVASPLVYALILRGLGSTGTSSYLVIGIQNGFACLAITSSFLRTQEPSRPANGNP